MLKIIIGVFVAIMLSVGTIVGGYAFLDHAAGPSIDQMFDNVISR